MRPSTSGRSSIDCTASIWPVARIASTTVSVRATATSTGIAGGPPLWPPFAPGSPADSALLHAASAASTAAGHTLDISLIGLTATSLFVKSRRPRIASSPASARRAA